jgi:hypothetical protein
LLRNAAAIKGVFHDHSSKKMHLSYLLKARGYSTLQCRATARSALVIIC